MCALGRYSLVHAHDTADALREIRKVPALVLRTRSRGARAARAPAVLRRSRVARVDAHTSRAAARPTGTSSMYLPSILLSGLRLRRLVGPLTCRIPRPPVLHKLRVSQRSARHPPPVLLLLHALDQLLTARVRQERRRREHARGWRRGGRRRAGTLEHARGDRGWHAGGASCEPSARPTSRRTPNARRARTPTEANHRWPNDPNQGAQIRGYGTVGWDVSIRPKFAFHSGAAERLTLRRGACERASPPIHHCRPAVSAHSAPPLPSSAHRRPIQSPLTVR